MFRCPEAWLEWTQPHNVNKSSLWHGYWRAPVGDSWWWLVGTSLCNQSQGSTLLFHWRLLQAAQDKKKSQERKKKKKKKKIWPRNGKQRYFAQICQSVWTNWLVNNVLVEIFRLCWQARETAVPGIFTHCWVQMAARSWKNFQKPAIFTQFIHVYWKSGAGGSVYLNSDDSKKEC